MHDLVSDTVVDPKDPQNMGNPEIPHQSYFNMIGSSKLLSLFFFSHSCAKKMGGPNFHKHFQ